MTSPKGIDRWNYIKDLRKRGVDDKDIAKSLDYSSVQSMWNWISRNKEKYQTRPKESFWTSALNFIAGDNKSAYLAGLFVGHFLRDVIDTGTDPELLKEINEYSMYSSVWVSFFFNGSFQKGLMFGLGIKELPDMVKNLDEWLIRLKEGDKGNI